MKLNGEELKKVDRFRYLGYVIYTDGTIHRDVDLRVEAPLSNWRQCIGVHLRPEDSPRDQSKNTQGHNQTGTDVWERMLGDEGGQQTG